MTCTLQLTVQLSRRECATYARRRGTCAPYFYSEGILIEWRSTWGVPIEELRGFPRSLEIGHNHLQPSCHVTSCDWRMTKISQVSLRAGRRNSQPSFCRGHLGKSTLERARERGWPNISVKWLSILAIYSGDPELKFGLYNILICLCFGFPHSRQMRGYYLKLGYDPSLPPATNRPVIDVCSQSYLQCREISHSYKINFQRNGLFSSIGDEPSG